MELHNLLSALVYEQGGYNDATVCIFSENPLSRGGVDTGCTIEAPFTFTASAAIGDFFIIFISGIIKGLVSMIFSWHEGI
jgi:hypothetical protein